MVYIGENTRNVHVRIEEQFQIHAMTLNLPITYARTICIRLAGAYSAWPNLFASEESYRRLNDPTMATQLKHGETLPIGNYLKRKSYMSSGRLFHPEEEILSEKFGFFNFIAIFKTLLAFVIILLVIVHLK